MAKCKSQQPKKAWSRDLSFNP